MIDEAFKLIDQYDKIVFLGDYADNWNANPPATIGTWRYLKLFMESYPDKVCALIGNHDYAYIHHEISGRSSGWSPITQQLINSPENKKIKDWLLTLPIEINIDGVTFTHAGRDVNWNTSNDVRFVWSEDSPLWNRPGSTVYGPEPQVFSHTPQSTCNQLNDNVWCIDTFSEHRDNSPIGDNTILEIIDGKEFNVRGFDYVYSDTYCS